MQRFVAACTLILVLSLSSLATTVERLTLDDMVKKAQSIVHGKVRGSRTYWSSDGRLIMTAYTLEVEETIKGQAAGSVELTTLGGKIGDTTLFVSGMPAFAAGEDAVVFIEKSAGFSVIVGLSQGKFAVENGQVSNRVSDLSFADGRAATPMKMGFEDFKREIRNRLNR